MSFKKIKVAFVYRPCSVLTSDYFFTVTYNFFMKSLRRNKRIDITYIPTGQIFDGKILKNKYDVVLLVENADFGSGCMPDEVFGMVDLDIPVIARVGDPFAATKKNTADYHKKFKINAFFGFHHEQFFHQYYPKDYKYKTILFGVEPSLYQNLTPYGKRIKNRILNSGAIANKKLSSKILCKFTKGDANPSLHYKLRTKCNELPYVDYTSTLEHEFIGDKYPLLLQKYSAAIAATTTIYTTKYWEIPAAGCLTFMEITEKNHGEFLGFKDGKSAIFINEKNYITKFEEYLHDTENPKWEKIANAGRDHALNNLNNDVAVNSLVDLMEELIQK